MNRTEDWNYSANRTTRWKRAKNWVHYEVGDFNTTPNTELSKLVEEWSKGASRHIGIDLWNDGYAHAQNNCARELQCLMEKSIAPTKTSRRLDDDLW